ncbi:receptor-type tyrosine-protein phosphatase S-like isoform X10 [Tenebrio molitor]|uniref:receptor-type tyrosine-protein phosphatase S-like isoform X10 n=2 Tax=Tenebrio molitor TaxID=7067 RepID=UPI00362480E6
MWLYLCYILTRTFILAEVITLIKNDNVTCVLTGDSVYSGLYISPLEDQKGLNRTQILLDSWVNDDWFISNNISQYRPMTDIRWESFENLKFSTIKLENNSILTFSVCHKNELVFKLTGDGAKNERSFKVKKSGINQHFCKWSHYALHIRRKSIAGTFSKLLAKIFKNYELWNLYDDKPIESLNFNPKWLIMGDNETVKIVKHKFRYSNRISENDSHLDISHFSKNLCIFMFVSVDMDCYLNVTLKSGNETVNETVIGFNKENSLKEWKKIEIEIKNNFTENAKLMFFRGRSNDNKEGYWAVDNIAFCRPSVDTKNIILPTNISYSSRCKVLDTNLADTKICENRGYIGKHCNISCSQVLGKSYPNCETYKICSENSNCSCAWGYEGEFCNKTCDSGRWGMNCSLNCGANCETCDKIKGCTKCKKKFFQDYPDYQCDETLPVLMRPPVLKSITEHSLTVFVNMTYDQSAKIPEYYQIQYKNSDEKKFQNYSQPKHFNNGGNVTETISNLSTTKLEYEIRIILVVQNQSFTDELKTLLTSRRTLEATFINHTINLMWNSSVRENAVTYLIEYECFKDFCEQRTNGSASTNETNLKIDVLPNFRTCNIQLFSNNTTNRKLLIDQVSVRSANSSSDINATLELPKKITLQENRVNIELESCEGFNGQLNYTFMYQCVSQWCNKEIQFAEIVLTEHNDSFNKQIQGLKPFSDYRVNVTAIRGNNSVTRTYGTIRTPPGKPQAVRNLIVFCKNESALWIKWQAPYPPTGNVSLYNITLKDGETTQNSSSNSSCELWDDFSCATFTELKKETNYTIIVQAKNEGVQEEGNEVNVTTQTIQEECPAPPNLRINLSSKPKEIILSWDHPLIMNGPLEKFVIEINEKIIREPYNITERKYQRTYNYTIPVEEKNVYRISVRGINQFKGERVQINATSYSLFVNYSSIPIVEWCSSSKCFLLIPKPEKTNGNFSALIMKNDGKYSEDEIKNTYRSLLNNSHLNESKWIVKMSSSQNDGLEVELGDMFNRSIFEKNSTHLMYLIQDDVDGLTVYALENKSNKRIHMSHAEIPFIPIIIGITIVAITILICGFLCYACKYKKFPFKTGQEHKNIAEKFELIPKRNIQSEPTLLNNNTQISKPIKINDLEQYFLTSLEDDPEDNQITQQFEAIPKECLKKSNYGRLPENFPKNRYKNTIAYDDTRVILEYNDEEGDYINANYVNGYDTPKAFIATQAPLPTTVQDFWLMICQENVTTIVMLTEVRENGIVKCEQYWPDFPSTCRFGKFLIENVSTKIFPDYIERNLQVKYENTTHFVQHFQYITWPDHGVPLCLQAFTSFMKQIEDIHKVPMVVHCNAGCGRTGTLILCDIILKMANHENQVDFPGILRRIRNARIGLVTTVDQYIFAHRVILEYLFGQDFSIPINEKFESNVNKAVNLKATNLLMQHLAKAIDQYQRTMFKLHHQFTDEEKAKNRFSHILPGHSQVFLPLTVKNSSNYINAVSVDCYRYPRKFILTQQPMPNTVEDFWTLILEYEIDTIVSLNEIVQDDQSCPRFWPTRKERLWSFGDSMEITFLNRTKEDSHDTIRVKINDVKEESKKKIVNIINMKNWKRETLVPANVKDLILVWKRVMKSSNQIIVSCYDGATASGLFAALAYLLEKMNMDHNCDVFSAVKTVRQGRPQCVQSVEQLEFLYWAAVEYLREFKIYDNFNG